MGTPGARPELVAHALESSHTRDGIVDPSAAMGTVTEWEMPDDLTDNGKAVWSLVVPPLLQAKILREEDLLLVVECVEAWGMVRQFRKELQAEMAGLNEQDTVKKLRTSWNQSLTQAKSLMSDLGMGPVARARLGMGRDAAGGLLGSIPQFGSGDGDT